MTQIETAKKGIITREMLVVAQREEVEPELIRREVAAGRIVIPANIHHIKIGSLVPMGIGRPISTKINANIGNSVLASGIKEELQKLEVAVKYGADTAMDLSTGGNLDEIRMAIIKESPIPIGTVPIYQTVKNIDPDKMTLDDLLWNIENQAKQGVDYMTIHAGVLLQHLPLISKRLAGIVSRGGSLIAHWMVKNRKENPLYRYYDDVLAILREHDVTISLGDSLRPGCLADASDEAQFAELRTLGELTIRAREAGVQVMVEGPGHIPFNQIQMNMELQSKYCHGAPFYVLGPLVTDVAPGYDHITSAIGATAAAYYGASFLCYVTPKEHLGLPNTEDVKQGVIAYKIAAHAGDVARGYKNARKWDDELSKARADLDWEQHFHLAMDEETARKYRNEDLAVNAEFCSMCGPKFCSMRISKSIKEWNVYEEISEEELTQIHK